MERFKHDYVEKLKKQAIKKEAELSSLSVSAVREIEKIAQKRGKNTAEEKFKVMPNYAYPNTRFNRAELQQEMNKKSAHFHDLGRLQPEPGQKVVGQLAVEILQCFGIPKPDLIGETSAFCIAVCESHAFKTDVMPPVANPMWLSRMRRACIFPVYHAYASLMIGVFGQQGDEKKGAKDSFAGRVAVDLARLRPNCTYDVTLPLRQSVHVYSRQQRGAIRFCVHLTWHSERQALLSYLPKSMPNFTEPNEEVKVQCVDDKAFQNVARVVHGDNMPGQFTKRQLQATIREINFTRIHVLRYLRKREFRDTTQWRHPVISGFVFSAWMHCVYTASVAYVPGHLVTYLLLHLWKNYAHYALDSSPVQNGFIAPTFEEMLLALLRGDSHNNCIEPLEMEMKDESSTPHSPLQDDNRVTSSSSASAKSPSEDEGSSSVSLEEIANAFRAGVKGRTLRLHFRTYHNAFRGTEAVDFLVNSGYAVSRQDAVALGRRLASELQLFEHVRRNHEFKDEGLFYTFICVDAHTYGMKTHQSWGKPLFGVLGFLPKEELSESEAHLEMPFSSGIDHPRKTVKESLVIRSKESQRMLLQEQIKEANLMNAKTQSQELADGLDQLFGEEDEKGNDGFSEDEVSTDLDEENESSLVEITVLKKPPQQDIDVRIKADKKIAEVLAEVRHKVHGFLLHLFNDRVYKIDDVPPQPDPTPSTSATSTPVGSPARSVLTSVQKKSWHKKPSFRSSPRRGEPTSTGKDVAATQDEYNRLLGIDKYSHGNPWIAKVGVIVQPIVEIALEWVCLFRALFNVFTWRDPFLSFWVSIIGPIAVVLLHFFPWRWILGILGVVLVGPQNWLLRVLRERKYGPDPFDPDKIIKKKKKFDKAEKDPAELPLFSMTAPDNRPVCNSDLDPSNVRKVVVPSSQLMYQRFYDWPPENEYSRVYAEPPPTGDTRACDEASVRTSGSESENGFAMRFRVKKVLSSPLVFTNSLKRVRQRRKEKAK